MISKTFIKNKDGKIEFTERELKELLDDIYKDGYRDGKGEPIYVYTSPSWWKLNQPYFTYSTTTTPLRNGTYPTTTATSTSNIASTTSTSNKITIEPKGEK